MKRLLLLFLLSVLCILTLKAQCVSGYTRAKLDWDYLDYLPSTGNGPYTNLSQSQTQYFVLGGQRVKITHNYSNGTNISAIGENIDHTGEGSSYGDGADVEFQQNGVITINFEKPVSNVTFSVYDIDYSQKVTIAALNGVDSTNVSLSGVSGTQLTFTRNNTASATANGPITTAIANTSSNGTANVDVAGPVTSIILTITQTGTKTNGNASDRESGSFFISDISACTPTVTGGNYFQVAKPFTGQPGYILVVKDNKIFYVNPADGKAKFLFTDPGHGNINSLAYDPVNHYVYYVYSLSGPVVDGTVTTNPSNRTLRRYDYNMDTLGIVLQDVASIGAPTLEAGVESGAAAFYNGSLYLGIEAKSDGSFESIIWKIDFNGPNPYQASQQFAVNGAGHDWSDFGISNDTLYDFDGVSTAASRNFYHLSLKTGTTINLTPATGIVPRQTSTDWLGQVYNVGSPDASATGAITPYLYNGNVNTSLQRTITYKGVAETGSWGDAADAFVPKVDFGDAPASYDPISGDPALHETDTSLFLGTSVNKEWSKRLTSSAADDDIDEALAYATILTQDGSYVTTATVYNNTGADATLVAWLDLNGNGLFDVNEGITYTVPSSTSPQRVDLLWPTISHTLINNSFTYLRLRLSSAANALTTAKATGYMADGEVEDYRVLVSYTVLTTRLTSFEAKKGNGGDVQISWEVANETSAVGYELQKSSDGVNWTTLLVKQPQRSNVKMTYSFLDKYPYQNTTYYRVKITEQGITRTVSTVKKVVAPEKTKIGFTPNPAYKQVKLQIDASEPGEARVYIYNVAGTKLFEQTYALQAGVNTYPLPQIDQWKAGVYQAEIWIGNEKQVQKLIVNR